VEGRLDPCDTCILARPWKRKVRIIFPYRRVMGGTRLTVPPLYEKQGCFGDLPSGQEGCSFRRNHRPNQESGDGERSARAGEGHIICMGRAMIADSEIVDNPGRGELDDIRLCLGECRGCIDHEIARSNVVRRDR